MSSLFLTFGSMEEQQASVQQLSTIIEQSPEDQPQQDHVILNLKDLLQELTSEGNEKVVELCMASFFGEHDRVKYLFEESKGLSDDDGWNDKNRAWLLQKCVEGDMFDIARQILKDHRELASGGELLRTLARKTDAFVENSSNFLRRTVNWLFSFVCPKEGHPKKDTQALELLSIILEDIAKMRKEEIDDMIRGPADMIKKDDRLPSANISRTPSKINAKKTYSSHTLFIAAEMGNTKFVVELIHKYQHLVLDLNANKQTIFHIAVIHRREGIYNLLYELGSMKDLITPLRDENGYNYMKNEIIYLLDENNNNMLHLVGKIANITRLQDVSGVAFQMLRELLWFKEVESMIPPSYKKCKNNAGLTPYALFINEHTELVAKCEEWMKGTASHCMVVAALNATVVFAAAFTVPGGYNQANGIPIFESNATFMVFVVADAISFFSSAASILMFLSILTSRYTERDFLQSLPKKLMLGLATLFLSITTMTIAFSVSFFVLYYKHLIWAPILITLCGAMPIFLFAWLICPLLADVYRSTYGSTYLFRPKKHVLYCENRTHKPFFMRLFSKCT